MKTSSVFRSAFAIAISYCAICTSVAFAVPQDAAPVAKKVRQTRAQVEPQAQYLITVSEYRFKDLDPTQLTAKKLASAIKTKAAPVETIVLSGHSGLESKVRYGREVTVNTGRSSGRSGSSRSKVRRDLGTVLTVTPTTVGNQVSAVVSFSSTRNVGEGTDDSPPELTATSIETTQLVDLDSPILIGASSAEETSYVFLTVSRR